MSTVDLQKELQHLKESSSLSGPSSTSQMTSKGAIPSSTPIRIGNAADSSSPAGSVVNVMASSGPATGSQIQHHSLHQSISSSYVGSTANQSIGGATGTPPSSAGGKQTSAEEKIIRRTSMQVLLPKRPSTDSLSNSPGPSSPGIANWGDSSSKFDGNTTDKISSDTTKLNRKESYKAQRKNYRREKKRVASELLNSLQDPAVIVLADWLKVRGTLKSWTKLWCVLKPGLLLLYKSPKTKSSHWVGTILLTSCQVIERPSKKDGFCFKLFHPLEQSIWAPRGPDKETIGAVVQPLPTAYLIFRAPSQAAGKCWMDALELSLRCSALLLRSNSNSGTSAAADTNATGQISHETQWSEADYEKHFNDQGLDRSDRLAQVQALLDKYHQQYASNNHLTVDDATRCSTSSLSLAPSSTPLFQPLYFAKINWERMLANTPDFHKIKTMRRFHRRSSRDCDEMSDVSTGIEFFTGRRRQFKKSASMHSLGRTDQTSDDEETPRRLSTPGVLPKFVSDLDVDSQNEGAAARTSGAETDSESDNDVDDVDELTETPYVHYPEEEFGAVGEQVEELPEEQKSLLWFLVKQVRPGMDLSKVVLPTFILEPRSFLDKLSDSYYHADILSEAVLEDDPFTRMKKVVRWYMSGFYKKPKGLKKPYNPIIGETFRCFWEHPNGSRTYYIAEQVSHHPPVSAFYVTNRQDGFAISCSILARSKFYGNSTSAVLEGVASLTLLPRGECYTMTTPYANCKGILMGTLSMELGGKVTIECENTGYKADIEFKLKPFLGGSDQINLIQGKIKMGKETLATLSGHWDSEILIKDSRTSEESVLFSSTPETKQKRLKRYCVPLDSQESMESERLWQLVSAAIRRDDQVAATEEKTALEDMQRNAAKERKVMLTEWIPVYFEQDMLTGQWIYKHADLRPWDPRNDLKQYESQFHVLTKTRHKAPAIRTGSIVSSDQLNVMRADSRQSLSALKAPIRTAILSSASLSQMSHLNAPTDSSQEEEFIKRNISTKSIKRIIVSVDEISKILEQHTRQLNKIHTMMERTQYAPVHQHKNAMLSRTIGQDTVIKGLLFALLGISISVIIKFMFK